MIQVFLSGLFLWVFLARICPCHRAFLLPAAWPPGCPNSCVIKRKATPGNWQALLIENCVGNHLAQGKVPLIHRNTDHHLSVKLVTLKY